MFCVNIEQSAEEKATFIQCFEKGKRLPWFVGAGSEKNRNRKGFGASLKIRGGRGRWLKTDCGLGKKSPESERGDAAQQGRGNPPREMFSLPGEFALNWGVRLQAREPQNPLKKRITGM